jgi:hypothetical protein
LPCRLEKNSDFADLLIEKRILRDARSPIERERHRGAANPSDAIAFEAAYQLSIEVIDLASAEGPIFLSRLTMSSREGALIIRETAMGLRAGLGRRPRRLHDRMLSPPATP